MLNYKHFLNMTDAMGMLQFSQLNSPDPGSGYTLDDNARALMVALNMEEGHELAFRFASFLKKCEQTEDGSWCNLFIDGKFSSRCDSEDSIGRALLACSMGTLSQWEDIARLCTTLMDHNLPRVINFSSPRAIAYTLLALCIGPGLDKKHLLNTIAEYLLSLYRKKKSKSWYWFEDYLTYCNGILPQAMLAVYAINGDKRFLKAGLDSLNFLNSILFREGYLNIIGNQGWYSKGGNIPLYDQQPVDAASASFACYEAYKVTARSEYLKLAELAHAWYRGNNIHELSLYNPHTGGCFDAITKDGVNLNQGAEAILSLLLTDLLMAGGLSKKETLHRSG